MTMFTGDPFLVPPPPPPPDPSKRSKRSDAILWSSIAATLVIGAVGVMWAPAIVDQVAVWSGRPSAQVEEIADRAGFTDDARFVFHASAPRVEADDVYEEACAADEDHDSPWQSIGCFVPTDKSIHIRSLGGLGIDDVEVITGAHELLHAVWYRMEASERRRIGAMLEATVAAHADDIALEAALAPYADVDDASRASELHSIIGTEVAVLDPQLEAHYAAYFDDRAALVALNAG